jgi:dipeptidase E
MSTQRKKEPRLMLAGGGNEVDSAPLDRIFASWMGRGGRILYIPIAQELNAAGYEGALRWLRSVFEPLGVGEIEMWTSLRERTAGDLRGFDAVYVGGGNTFRLLSLVREAGFDEHLREYFAGGGAIYGGSAGAIIMGSNILTAYGDPNDVALVDTRGLDLASGHSIWCHYEEARDPHIYEYIHKYSFPVLAIPERAGVGIEGDRMVAWGHEPVYRFTHRRKRAIPPGEQI